MKKTALMAVLGLLLVVGMVSAYRGDYTTQGPNFSEERHELMEEAFSAEDYDAWVELMNENARHGRVLDIVNEDNFGIFVEAHELAENGQFEEAATLRAELGLGNGQGPRDGTGFGKGMKGNGNNQGLRDGSGQGRMQGNCMYN